MTHRTRRWLKKNDCDPKNLDLQGSFGNTALMKASRQGDLMIVKELLDYKVDIHLKNIDGNTALWAACFGNNPEIVTLLISHGIEIDTRNINGITPLMYAASSEREKIVEILINAGADITLKTPDDFKAIDLAVTPKILKLLRNAG